MRGNEERRERNEAVARYKLRRSSPYEAPPAPEDMAIPDYVMRDFGSLDGSRDESNGRRRAPEIWDVGEDLGAACG